MFAIDSIKFSKGLQWFRQRGSERRMDRRETIYLSEPISWSY